MNEDVTGKKRWSVFVKRSSSAVEDGSSDLRTVVSRLWRATLVSSDSALNSLLGMFVKIEILNMYSEDA